MKNKQNNPFAALGASSLLVIFTVLSLTVFAMLSLSSVLAQQRLSDSSLEAMEEYYAADLAAQTLFARLRAGEEVSGVKKSGNRYTFHCPASSHQTLYAEVEKTREGWTVLRWQLVAAPEEVSETLAVYQGG